MRIKSAQGGGYFIIKRHPHANQFPLRFCPCFYCMSFFRCNQQLIVASHHTHVVRQQTVLKQDNSKQGTLGVTRNEKKMRKVDLSKSIVSYMPTRRPPKPSNLSDKTKVSVLQSSARMLRQLFAIIVVVIIEISIPQMTSDAKEVLCEPSIKPRDH